MSYICHIFTFEISDTNNQKSIRDLNVVTK